MLQGNFIQEKKIELGTRWSREDEATAQPRWAPLIPHSTGMRSMRLCSAVAQLSSSLWSCVACGPSHSTRLLPSVSMEQPLSRAHRGCQNGDLSL